MDVELDQEDVQNIINAYDKDIKKIKKLEKENRRLNNIINKLEEYCWELKAMGCREGALDMLDKIKALKENN